MGKKYIFAHEKCPLKDKYTRKRTCKQKNSAHNGTTFAKVSYICRADEVKATGSNARSIKRQRSAGKPGNLLRVIRNKV
jgi:hypothetical protein